MLTIDAFSIVSTVSGGVIVAVFLALWFEDRGFWHAYWHFKNGDLEKEAWQRNGRKVLEIDRQFWRKGWPSE